MLTFWITLTGLALCMSVVASEYRNSTLGKWIAKPLASTAFVIVGWLHGMADTPFGHWLFLGLLLCWLGDVLLLSRKSRWFLAGLAAFLLGHLAFLVAFTVLGIELIPALVALLVITALSVPIVRWLLRAAPPAMRVPVIAYFVVIVAMVAAAFGAWRMGAPPALPLAAVLFMVSDISVAMHRFVSPSPHHRLWGLPMYYASVFLIAWLPIFMEL